MAKEKQNGTRKRKQKRVTIFFTNEVENNGCRYPIQIEGDQHRWCNEQRADGKNYCEVHHKLCHLPTISSYFLVKEQRAKKTI
jgi:hypothetical protein